MANSEAGAGIGGAGRQSINRRRDEKMKSNERIRRGGHKGQLSSHPASHGIRKKVSYTEKRKEKNPEGKGSWDNLS